MREEKHEYDIPKAYDTHRGGKAGQSCIHTWCRLPGRR
jgi:hypothetical protein